MSQKNVLIIVIVVLVVLAGGLLAWYFIQDEGVVVTNTNTTTNTVTTNTETLNTAMDLPGQNEVFVIEGSFNPSVVTINVGDTITWTNQDEIDRQVASDPYPTNTDLPDLVSNVLSTGDDFSYTFEEAGTFFYHDNLNPISKGTVIVE